MPPRYNRPIVWWLVATGLLVMGLALAVRTGALVFVRGWPLLSLGSPVIPTGDEAEDLARELVEAAAAQATRPVEGRLTGGFKYVPRTGAPDDEDDAAAEGRRITRGDAPGESSGDKAGAGGRTRPRGSAALRLAAARLDLRAERSPSAAADAGAGVAALLLGDVDRAIELLESSLRRAPAARRAQSDLSAAYLSRARVHDRGDDWIRGLAAADRALRHDASLTEARFNRAVALHALHLHAEAEQAWRDYLAIDTDSGWAREARARIEQLARRKQRYGSPGGSVLASAPDADLQAIRQLIEDDLLPQWAAAAAAPGRDADANAIRALGQARERALALAAAGGDTMSRDAIVQIDDARAQGDSAKLAALAAGHRAFAQARRLFLAEDLRAATAAMEEAAIHFRRGGSPYQWWGAIYRGIELRMRGSARDALAIVESIPIEVLPRSYLHLRGRVHWTRAIGADALGRLDFARSEFVAAAALFRQARELEHRTATTFFAAEAEWFLGNPIAAWRLTRDALASLDRLPVSTRRNVVLLTSAYFALSDDLPEAALYFQNTLIASLERAGATIGRAGAFAQRARILLRLDRRDEALADLERARQYAEAVSDPVMRARAIITARVLHAELYETVDPARAVAEIEGALKLSRPSEPYGDRSRWLRLAARAHMKLGQTERAHEYLHAALDAFEQARASLTTPLDRMQAFEAQRDAVSELAAFELFVRRDASEAMRIAERGRAPSFLGEPGRSAATIRDPMRAAREIPPGTSVIYYVTLNQRRLTWVLTRDGGAQLVDDRESNESDAFVADLERAVQRGATLAALEPLSAALYRQVISPALPRMRGATRIVVITDGALTRVPFAILSDGHGQLLLDRFVVSAAPSLSSYLAGLTRRTGTPSMGPPDTVRALGDGHDPVATGLPWLPLADAEATEVGELYPRRTVLPGREATRRAFLEAGERVIHYAGHSVVNHRYPLYSRLLLAPSARGAQATDDGALLASELVAHRFEHTDVLVLASCDSAAGPFVPGEGVISLSRLFVEAGIASVVASLWPVDERAKPLHLRLHRALRDGLDPAAALQAAQKGTLADGGREMSVQVWGGYVAVGGSSPGVRAAGRQKARIH
jgi:CHAT domain-containing protein